MTIKITDAEIREAIKLWLDDHGVPSASFKLTASVRPNGQAYLTAVNVETIEVTVETEAPHMEGPYR